MTPGPTDNLELLKWHQEMIEKGIKEGTEAIKRQIIAYTTFGACMVGAIAFIGWQTVKDVKASFTTRLSQMEQKVINDTVESVKLKLHDQPALLQFFDDRYVLSSQPYAIQPYDRDNVGIFQAYLVLTLDDPNHRNPANPNNYAKIAGYDHQRWAFVAEKIKK